MVTEGLATDAAYERVPPPSDWDRVRAGTGSYDLLHPSEKQGHYVFFWRKDAPAEVRAQHSIIVSLSSFFETDDPAEAITAIREARRHDKGIHAWCDVAGKWLEERADENRRRQLLAERGKLQRRLEEVAFELEHGYAPPHTIPCWTCAHRDLGRSSRECPVGSYWDCYEVVEKRPRSWPERKEAGAHAN